MLTTHHRTSETHKSELLEKSHLIMWLITKCVTILRKRTKEAVLVLCHMSQPAVLSPPTLSRRQTKVASSFSSSCASIVSTIIAFVDELSEWGDFKMIPTTFTVIFQFSAVIRDENPILCLFHTPTDTTIASVTKSTICYGQSNKTNKIV